MSKVFFDELDLPKPDAFLEVGSSSQACQTANVVVGMEAAIEKLKLSVVCVEGDTNSVLGGAIAAKKSGCLLAHVESGARSYDRKMPEEVNRVVCDHLSDLLFAATENCLVNLRKEGIAKNVFLSGNTDVETISFALEKKKQPSFSDKLPVKFALATLHRVSNVNEQSLSHFWDLLASLGLPVLFLVHPRTEAALEQYGLLKRVPKNVLIEEPVGYFELLWLLEKSSFVLTDSGGLQVEAAVMKRPVLLLRDRTEWVEIVESGAGACIGLDSKSPALAKKFISSFAPRKVFSVEKPSKIIVSKLLELAADR